MIRTWRTWLAVSSKKWRLELKVVCLYFIYSFFFWSIVVVLFLTYPFFPPPHLVVVQHTDRFIYWSLFSLLYICYPSFCFYYLGSIYFFNHRRKKYVFSTAVIKKINHLLCIIAKAKVFLLWAGRLRTSGLGCAAYICRIYYVASGDVNSFHDKYDKSVVHR